MSLQFPPIEDDPDLLDVTARLADALGEGDRAVLTGYLAVSPAPALTSEQLGTVLLHAAFDLDTITLNHGAFGA